MADLITLFKGSTGLNNKVDPVRINFNPDTGVQDFAAVVNCDLDRTGRPSRRKGYVLRSAGNYHSVFNVADQYCVAVDRANNRIVAFEDDWVIDVVKTGIDGDNYMSYALVEDGTNWVVYFANGADLGKITNKVYSAWTASSYAGVKNEKRFEGPPQGHMLAVRMLRMWVAQDNHIWYSEPLDYSKYHLPGNRLSHGSRITMMAPVDQGMWISDQKKISFAAGEIMPATGVMPRLIHKANYAAIEGTQDFIDMDDLPFDVPAGIGVMFTSTKGICVGTPDGNLINLTHDKLNFPTTYRGSAVVINDRYIVNLKP